ncbi:ParB/RepB/Spo0J family partition protein [Paenibacillus odorifer]|uniref:ParB-like N-terminal domain-containing protein n=1 Tax=Paenibacillus odorifer TaxID=189426 RepID=A0A1R0Y9J8_9BACL|nr:ParB/RepB/Spo0J family partition protein [Paenibacillus odorifer]OMD44040.1 hypothetical protein BSK52_00370 [Paenibacillus odorifer]
MIIEKRKTYNLTIHPLHDEIISKCSKSEMLSLETSIRDQGILYPLLVNQENQIIDGTSRWTIAKKLNIQEVSVLIIDISLSEELLTTINETRRDNETDLIKLAKKIQRFYILFGIKRGPKKGHDVQKEACDIAAVFKMSYKKMSRLLKLLELIQPIQDLISNNKIGIVIGNHIASRLETEKQYDLYQIINSMDITKMKDQDLKILINQVELDLLTTTQVTKSPNCNTLGFEDFHTIIQTSSGDHYSEVMSNITSANVERIIKDVKRIQRNTLSCYENIPPGISIENHRELINSFQEILNFLHSMEVH